MNKNWLEALSQHLDPETSAKVIKTYTDISTFSYGYEEFKNVLSDTESYHRLVPSDILDNYYLVRDAKDLGLIIEKKSDRYNREKDFVRNEDIIVLKVIEIGGISGGSCWDNSNPQRYDKNEIDYQINLFKQLELMNISVSHSQVIEIEEKIRKNTYTDYEYYGNNTDYEYHYMLIIELWNLLKGT